MARLTSEQGKYWVKDQMEETILKADEYLTELAYERFLSEEITAEELKTVYRSLQEYSNELRKRLGVEDSGGESN